MKQHNDGMRHPTASTDEFRHYGLRPPFRLLLRRSRCNIDMPTTFHFPCNQTTNVPNFGKRCYRDVVCCSRLICRFCRDFPYLRSRRGKNSPYLRSRRGKGSRYRKDWGNISRRMAFPGTVSPNIRKILLTPEWIRLANFGWNELQKFPQVFPLFGVWLLAYVTGNDYSRTVIKSSTVVLPPRIGQISFSTYS